MLSMSILDDLVEFQGLLKELGFKIGQKETGEWPESDSSDSGILLKIEEKKSKCPVPVVYSLGRSFSMQYTCSPNAVTHIFKKHQPVSIFGTIIHTISYRRVRTFQM